MSFENIMLTLYNLFTIVIESAYWIWNSVTTPLSHIFETVNIPVPDYAIFDLTLGHLLLGGLGLFMVYTLIKWVIDIVW